jgi:mono/diheme cytochrome c family protein
MPGKYKTPDVSANYFWEHRRSFTTASVVTALFFFPSIGEAQDRWGCPPEMQELSNPVALSTLSVDAGNSAAMEYGCLACHGQRGLGDGPAARSLTQKPANGQSPEVIVESDGCLFWKITTGRRPMPASATLLEKQRWDLVNFIRSFQRR